MLTVSLAAVEKGVDAMIRAGLHLGDVFRAARADMRTDQLEHGRAQEGPEGKWPPRAAATIEKLRASRRRSRRPMGRLPREIDYKSSDTGVRGESRVPGSLAHMIGDRVGRGARLPVREFMWMSEKFLGKVAERVVSKVIDGFGGR